MPLRDGTFITERFSRNLLDSGHKIPLMVNKITKDWLITLTITCFDNNIVTRMRRSTNIYSSPSP